MCVTYMTLSLNIKCEKNTQKMSYKKNRPKRIDAIFKFGMRMKDSDAMPLQIAKTERGWGGY